MATNGTTLDIPTPPKKRAMTTAPVGNQFTENDRLYRSYTEFSTVFEELDLDLSQIRMMLSKDGNPRKLEQVLTLPIRGSGWEIRGKGPEADLARDNLGPLLNEVIAQATSAFSYRKAFFEIVWKLEGDQVLYDQILMRPAVTCEAGFDEHTGEPLGFRQRLAPVSVFGTTTGELGYERIPKIRSFIYTYGTHREPLRGLSDMDVALYCWDQIRKLQFLWCQYLEGQSLPKILVKGSSPEEAQENARQIARAKASGVIPVEWRPEMGEKLCEVLESSGKGAEQFETAIRYFEGKQTSSVLASFTDLAQAAVAGKGSNALSADQSEFFLSACQGKADEMSWQITKGLIEPLVRYNFGPDAEVPQLYIGPIGNRQLDRALDLLKSIMAAQNPTAPPKFTASLMTHVASFLGLEQEDVSSAAEEWANQQAEAEDYQAQLSELLKLQRAQLGAAAAGPQPPPGPNQAPPKPGQKALPPGKTKAEMAAGRDTALELAGPVQLQLNLTTDDDDTGTHTGGMVALLPDAESAAKLHVDGGDPIDQLHLTLCYLGDNVTGWSQSQRDQVVQRASSATDGLGPIDGDAFAHAVFNPDGEEPCAVYLVGGSDAFSQLNEQLGSLASVLQHPGFVAHVTAGYGMSADDLTYTGPVRFDRIGAFFGDQRVEIPLAGGSPKAPGLDLAYNPAELRIPHGSEGGRWTKGALSLLHSGPPRHHPEPGDHAGGGGSGAEHVASSLIAAAEQAERPTTPVLQELAAKHGADMVGLKFRVKEHKSLTRKIAEDAAKDDITPDEAGAAIADVLRYTMTAPAADNARMVQAVGDDLRARGYTFTKVKNTWGPNSVYRGINAQVATPDGYKFELQFHTPESFDVKQNQQHPVLERRRKVKEGGRAYKRMDREMKAMSETLQMPPGIKRIDLGADDHRVLGW